MHVLLFADRLSGGGTESQARLLAAHWPAAHGRIQLASLDPADRDALVLPRAWRFDLGPVAALRRVVADHDVDLVLCSHRFAGLLAKLARLPVPVVCSIRGRHHYGPREKLLYDHLDLHLMRRACSVVINSQLLADRFGAHPGLRGRVVMIPNGIDLPGFDTRRAALGEVAAAAPTLAALGRLVPIKEPHLAVDTLAELHRRGHAARLVWIGDGPQRAEVERRVARHGLGDFVEITGFVDDPLPHLARSHLLLHTSSWENTSNAILEAMATSLPVVARNVGGNRETVEDGATGLLTAGEPGALAAAVETLLQDPARAAEMGRAGRARVEERHSAAGMVQRYLDLFTRCLGVVA